MALCVGFRLCPRGFLSLHGARALSITECCRKVVIQPKLYKPPQVEGHDERNMRLKRPLSPHLTIYKYQLTAVLSITHRFTGIALSSYLAAIGVTSLIIDKPMIEFITSLSSNFPSFFILLKLGLVFPFTYHFFNGIRHLIWDSGKSLTIKGVYTSGYTMVLAALVSAVALFYC